VPLPRWAPLHVGSIEIDMSPTRHVVMLLFASFLACVVLITAAAFSAPPAGAEPVKTIDGAGVKLINLAPEGPMINADVQTFTGSIQQTPAMSCTPTTCWKQVFRYKPAKSVRGDQRDVLVTVSTSGIYNDIDLYVTDAAGNVLGACGRPVSDQEQVYLPGSSLRPGRPYTVVVRFVMVTPKASAGSGVTAYHTQGTVVMPSPVHAPFGGPAHAADSCGTEGFIP